MQMLQRSGSRDLRQEKGFTVSPLDISRPHVLCSRTRGSASRFGETDGPNISRAD
ncbi:hypothetical protein ILYODFUR_028673, partial [Ilyodon furcidens]